MHMHKKNKKKVEVCNKENTPLLIRQIKYERDTLSFY